MSGVARGTIAIGDHPNRYVRENLTLVSSIHELESQWQFPRTLCMSLIDPYLRYLKK
jgi:hypothetical protein